MDSKAPLIVTVYSSLEGIGYVLSQRQMPDIHCKYQYAMVQNNYHGCVCVKGNT